MNAPLDFHLVGGCGSSGTTLLAYLLDGLHDLRSGPELGACHHRALFRPEGFTRTLHALLTNRVEPTGLPVGELFVPLVPQVFLMDREFYGMPELDDAVAMLEACLEPRALFRWIKARLASKQGIHEPFGFVDQTPKNCVGAKAFLETFPECRFVHLLRDGRDVSLSLARRWSREAPGHDPGIYLMAGAVRWCWDVSRALEAKDHPGYMELRYEDLVGQPLDSINRVLVHLGREPVDHAGLFDKRSPSAEAGKERFFGGVKPSWTQQPDQGISTASVGRWRQLPPAALDSLLELRFELGDERYHMGSLLAEQGYDDPHPGAEP